MVLKQLPSVAQVSEDVLDSSSERNTQTATQLGRQVDRHRDRQREPCHQACVSCCLFQQVAVKVLTSDCGCVLTDQTCDLETSTAAVETQPYNNAQTTPQRPHNRNHTSSTRIP